MLNHLLLDRLKDSAPSRIVQVSAGLYPIGRIDLKRTPKGDDFTRFRTYANTKLCNLLCNRELARRLEGTGVTANSVHPGVVRTSLGSTQKGLQGWLLRRFKLFMRTPASGAGPPLHLALSSELEGVSDAFFNRFKRVKYHKVACDDALNRQLWDLSERLAGFRTEK
jgi:NAD(P)-dependent dehydrogenase (short-subunit alcohol dehydrogenase family)